MILNSGSVYFTETFGNALSSSHLMALAKAVGSKTFRCFSNTKGLLERPYINRHECTPLKRKVDVLKTLHDQENWSEKAYSIQKDMIPDDCTSDQSIRFSGISEGIVWSNIFCF